MLNERKTGPDIVRTAAIFFVVFLHGITMRGGLENDMFTPMWSIKLVIRFITLSAVPLFLMLSGYLMRQKKPCKKYFGKLIPLYLSYFAISLACIAATAVYDRISGNSDISLFSRLYTVFDFSADGYAWYFEMYIGLFLLIPFLNLMYSGIGTRRGKLTLIAILAFLTLAPDTLVSFAPYYGGGKLSLAVLPDFFKSAYPITYYFVGCYIAEYKPKLLLWQKLTAVAASVALPTLLCAVFSVCRGEYAWYMMNGFATFTVCATAISIFLAFYDLEINSKILKKAFNAISVCTFEMYLISYLWDSLLYRKLLSLYGVTELAVLIGSFLSAIALRTVIKPVSRLAVVIYERAVKA